MKYAPSRERTTVTSIFLSELGMISSTSIFVMNGGSRAIAVVMIDIIRLTISGFFSGATYFHSLLTILPFDWQRMHSAPSRMSRRPHLGQTSFMRSKAASAAGSSLSGEQPPATLLMNAAAISHSDATA